MKTCISTQYFRKPKLANVHTLTTAGSCISSDDNTTTHEISAGSDVIITPMEVKGTLTFDYFDIVGLNSDGTHTVSNENPFKFVMPDRDVLIMTVFKDDIDTSVQPTKTVTAEATQITVLPDAGYRSMAQVIVNPSAGAVIEPLAVVPGVSEQIFDAPTGVNGYDPVVVAATPTEERTFTANGVYNPTDGKFIDKVTVQVPSGEANIQASKTATPTSAQQTVLPDEGFDAMAQVIVDAVPIDPNNTFTANGTYSAAVGEYFETINVNVSGGGVRDAKTWTYTCTNQIGTGGAHVTELETLVTDEFFTQYADDDTLTITMYVNSDIDYKRDVATPTPSQFIFQRVNINSGIMLLNTNGDVRKASTELTGHPITVDGALRVDNGSLYMLNSTRAYLTLDADYTIIAEVGVQYV